MEKKHFLKLTVLVLAIGFSFLVMIGPAQNSHALSIYTADLSGPNESPPVPSPGTGFAQVDYDSIAHTLRVQATFSGLLGFTTASHIHAPTAVPGAGNIGVAITTPTFPGFPLGVQSGAYDRTLDLTLPATYSVSFLINFGGGTADGAEAALIAAMDNGTAYFNIHTTQFPGGEIRGFLQPVPEPATMLLLGSGLVGLAGYGRKKFFKK